MKNDYIKLFTDFLEKVEFLSDAECGRLVKALLLYKRDGRLPDIRGNEKILFPTFRAQIDRENEAYRAVCEKNSKNASMRWHTSACDRVPDDTKNAKNKEQRVKKKEDDARTRASISANPFLNIVAAMEVQNE